MSARIKRGAKTDRVRVKRRIFVTPGTAHVLYKRDPTVNGQRTVTLCISMPAVELVALDIFAEKVQMNRSHVIRQAVKHFRVKVTGK